MRHLQPMLEKHLKKCLGRGWLSLLAMVFLDTSKEASMIGLLRPPACLCFQEPGSHNYRGGESSLWICKAPWRVAFWWLRNWQRGSSVIFLPNPCILCLLRRRQSWCRKPKATLLQQSCSATFVLEKDHIFPGKLF